MSRARPTFHANAKDADYVELKEPLASEHNSESEIQPNTSLNISNESSEDSSVLKATFSPSFDYQPYILSAKFICEAATLVLSAFYAPQAIFLAPFAGYLGGVFTGAVMGAIDGGIQNGFNGVIEGTIAGAGIGHQCVGDWYINLSKNLNTFLQAANLPW